jgi:hypothetical protein
MDVNKFCKTTKHVIGAIFNETYASAFIQADIHCAFELYIGGLREFESTELGRQKVSINSVEVLKQVWIN